MRKFSEKHRQNLSIALKGRPKPKGAGCGLKPNKPEDIWWRILKGADHECWNFVGGKQGGYGAFRVQGVYYKAHRVAYFLTYGNISLRAPDDRYSKEQVLHKCDNRECCNPNHLYLGDIWDNMRDKVERGRQSRVGPKKKVANVNSGV